MTKSRSKTIATAVSLFLLFAMAISMIAFPAGNAQTYVSTGTCKTFAFIGATPNPVGVGQETLLHLGITQQLANVALKWEGLTVTVERPDGHTETLGPFKTDSTGGTGTIYVPTMTGNYTFQTHFPEQRNPATVGGMFSILSIPTNCTMLASDSDILTLMVQEEPIEIYPGVPLPAEYWIRPINSQFREWYTVSGSSWMDADYNEAPEAPHVLWTKPLTTGGLAGGELGLVGSGGTSVALENGDAYEGKWGSLFGTGALILAGKLYYVAGAYDRPNLIHCVDLRTSEELWAKTFLDNQSLSFGQLFYWQSYNYMGTFAYLWVGGGGGFFFGGGSATWRAFDPFTGEWVATITDVPSGTRITGSRGEIYIYSINTAQARMTLWNMSAFISMQGSWGSAFSLREYNASSGRYRSMGSSGSFGSWSSSGAADRAARAWALNISIPTGLPGSASAVKLGERVVGYSLSAKEVTVWAFSLEPGREGNLLFKKTWDAPAAWSNETLSWASTDLESNVGVVWSKEERTYYGFSLETGDYLWKTEIPQNYLDIYGEGTRIYKGKLYSIGYAGTVYCWDTATGQLDWSYNVEDPYTEILWSNNWPMSLYFTSGDKLYLFHTEHSGNQPLPRGAPAVCLNATTGEVIWRVDGLFRTTTWGGRPVMGDSVIAMYNTYDQLVYAIGKGPSATTVTASPKVSVYGSSVLVEGMVTDVSPGTKSAGLEMRFPNGVPAVSDDSVGEWMKYVYAQFPRPTNVTGVEVVLEVLDPNGNYYEVGRATSDASGVFHCAFNPEVPGEYTIVASFAGTGGYYGSFAETAINVEEAPATTPAPTATPAPMTDTYVLGIGAGAIIAIVIIGLVLILMLRKR